MNKYGVSVKLKVVPMDKQERAEKKATAKLYERYLEWRDDEWIDRFIKRVTGKGNP